jgi:ribosomal-protein-alanine N-acetyltransferase
MNAVLKPEVRLESLTEVLLDDVLRIENSAYAHPWTRGNFADSLKSGYQLLALLGGDTLIGYFVAMEGVCSCSMPCRSGHAAVKPNGCG